MRKNFTSWTAERALACCSLFVLVLATVPLLTNPSLNAQQNVRAVSQVVNLEPGLWLEGLRVLGQPTHTAMALSSDGRFIVYAAIKQNPGAQDKSQLYLRRLDQPQARPIAGTEGAINPFLSPDDRWVGFFANSKLMKVPVDGGTATALWDIINPMGGSWGPDGQIVFVPDYRAGLSRISADGGKVEILTKPDPLREENTHRVPHYLPGGKAVLFTIMRDTLEFHPRVGLLDLGTGKWRELIREAADARYLGTGHLAFMRGNTLMTVAFDLNKLEILGEATPTNLSISQGLTGGNTTNTGAGQFDISGSGSLVYVPGGVYTETLSSLVWVDQKGNAEVITPFKAPLASPRLSPDGQKILYRTAGRDRAIWIYDLNRHTRTALTPEGNANAPLWSPDGKRVVLGWSKTGAENVFWQAADGSSPLERLTTSEYYHHPSSFSPDGKTIAFIESTPGYGAYGHDIMLLNLSNRQITPLMNSRFSERGPEFSPDGHWLAYSTNESGRFQLYVQPFPGPGAKRQITEAGGSDPLWARNGKQLFYRWANQVWVVDVQTGSSFSAGKPRLVFENSAYGSTTGSTFPTWDISPDGQRFVMVKSDAKISVPVTGMILIQNWADELRRPVF
jgi:eukaryotic-like serine/threonine-protein kinase